MKNIKTNRTISIIFIIVFAFAGKIEAQPFEWDTLIDSFFVYDIEITGNGNIYIAGQNYYVSGTPADSCSMVMRSTDDGLIWENVLSPNSTNYGELNSTSIVKDDEDNLYVCYPKFGVLKSVDYGNSWYYISDQINDGENQEFFEVYFSSNGNLILGTNQRIYISTDRGVSWQNVSDTTLYVKWSHSFYDAPDGTIYGLLQNDNILYRSDDDGWTWTKLNIYYCRGICFLENGDILVTKQDLGAPIIRSTDNGSTWTQATDMFSIETYLGVLFRSSDNGIFLERRSSDYGIYYSETDGYQWEPAFAYDDNFYNGFVDFAEDSSSYIYAGRLGALYRIAGESLPVNLTSFSATVNNQEVTIKWTTASETDIKEFEIQRSISGDRSSSWKILGIVETKRQTAEIQNYSFTDYALGSGKYLYRLKQIDFDGSFEYGKEIEVEVASIQKFRLSQNYPNPFGKASVAGTFITTIEFELPKSGKTELKVFDILGKEIAVLKNGFLEAGKHFAKFDATGLPTGIYFYRLTSNGFSTAKKMTILK